MLNKISALLNNFLFEEITPLNQSDIDMAINLINDKTVTDTFKLRYQEKNIRVIAK